MVSWLPLGPEASSSLRHCWCVARAASNASRVSCKADDSLAAAPVGAHDPGDRHRHCESDPEVLPWCFYSFPGVAPFREGEPDGRGEILAAYFLLAEGRGNNPRKIHQRLIGNFVEVREGNLANLRLGWFELPVQ